MRIYQFLNSYIFKNLKNNINISKEIIKSLFQCISKNYQSLNNSCDSKQFQKYIDLINFFFYENIENKVKKRDYFIFHNSNANMNGLILSGNNDIISLKNNSKISIELLCEFIDFNQGGAILNFLFKHEGNILSINFDKGGNLFYEKNLKKIAKYDSSSMLNKTELENSEIINEYENINEKQVDIEIK